MDGAQLAVPAASMEAPAVASSLDMQHRSSTGLGHWLAGGGDGDGNGDGGGKGNGDEDDPGKSGVGLGESAGNNSMGLGDATGCGTGGLPHRPQVRLQNPCMNMSLQCTNVVKPIACQ